MEYTKSKLSSKSAKDIKQIRINAQKASRPEIVRLCDEALADINAIKQVGEKSVTEFHFVCTDGKNLRQENDGRYSTGKWVVAEKHARVASCRKAIVALHREKGTPSYWQGIVEDWRPTISLDDKTQHRVEFICTASTVPLEWCGEGSGEKGYRWSDGSQTAELD